MKTAALGTASLAFSGVEAFAADRMPVVVELFTSQGCSSCPPADLILGELCASKGVVAASFNVDYWDYIGWRDTLASPEFTRRQYDYARRLGKRQVYTPQMIVNGRHDVVGSRRREVLARVESEATRDPDTTVSMTIEEVGSELRIHIGDAPTDRLLQDATLWILMTTPKVVVRIERGENSGREITYHNVVRKIIPAGMWGGKAKDLTLPKSNLFVDGAEGCIAMLQVGGVGPVIAVATIGNVMG